MGLLSDTRNTYYPELVANGVEIGCLTALWAGPRAIRKEIPRGLW